MTVRSVCPAFFGEDELLVAVLCCEDAGQVFFSYDPIVHDVGVEQVAVAGFHPEADGLARAVKDEGFVELRCATGS